MNVPRTDVNRERALHATDNQLRTWITTAYSRGLRKYYREEKEFVIETMVWFLRLVISAPTGLEALMGVRPPLWAAPVPGHPDRLMFEMSQAMESEMIDYALTRRDEVFGVGMPDIVDE